MWGSSGNTQEESSDLTSSQKLNLATRLEIQSYPLLDSAHFFYGFDFCTVNSMPLGSSEN